MPLKTLPPRLGAIPARVTLPPKTVDPVYRKPEWQALLASVIAERGRRCEKCGRTGCRIYGDHIRELKDGGELLDRRNLMLLCAACHGRKTADARQARRFS